MPVLKFYDPATLTWEEVSTAGPPGPTGSTGPQGAVGPDEVHVSPTPPTLPGVDLWVDESVPTPPNIVQLDELSDVDLATTPALNGNVLTYNSATGQWVPGIPSVVDLSGLVQKSGDTMTGPLVLAADPSAPLQAATKQYVDTIPRVALTLDGTMTLTSTNTACSWTTLTSEDPQDPALWNAATPTLLLAPVAGVYELNMTLRVNMTVSTAGVTRATGEIFKNGVRFTLVVPAISSGKAEATTLTQTTSARLAAGDSMHVLLTSTGTGWNLTTGQASSYLTWRRL